MAVFYPGLRVSGVQELLVFVRRTAVLQKLKAKISKVLSVKELDGV